MRWWISTSWSGGCGAGCPKALLERRHERVGERAPRMVFGHDHFEIPLRAGRVVARAIDGFDGETRLPRHIGIRPAADLHRRGEVGDVAGAPKRAVGSRVVPGGFDVPIAHVRPLDSQALQIGRASCRERVYICAAAELFTYYHLLEV